MNLLQRFQCNRYYKIVFSLILLLFYLNVVSLYGQESVKSRLSLSVTQLPENKAYLESKLLVRINKRYVPAQNVSVAFYHIEDNSETRVGIVNTDVRGKAKFEIGDISRSFINEEGWIVYSAVFEGTDQYKGSSRDVEFKRANILVVATEEDEVKKVNVSSNGIDEGAELLSDYEIVMSVPRMYSDLVIEEGYTDEEGSAEFEVPNGIPGDENGNLDLKVRIIDAGDYGNLEANFTKQWGIAKAEVVAANRELWSPDAPLWMVLTFAVLMLAVWSHFAIIILQLFKLKKLGNEGV